jgi:mono/diheme cytochrome c family protein
MNVCRSSAGVLLLILGCQTQPPSEPVEAAVDNPVERGEYLVTVLACGDCHTPMKMGPAGPEPDLTRLLSGHPEGMTMPPVPALPEPWLWVGAATNTA